MNLRRLHVVTVGTGVADVWIRQRDNLAAIGRIRQDFLVAGHCGIENDLAYRLPVRADRSAAKYGAVL